MRRARLVSTGLALFVCVAVVVGACSGSRDEPSDDGPTPSQPFETLSAEEQAIVDDAVDDVSSKLREPLEEFTLHRVLRLDEVHDERLAWVVSDLMQFVFRGEPHEVLVATAERLAGVTLPSIDQRKPLTDALIDRDTPAPPGYVEWKRELYTSLEPAWAPFFEDRDAAVDWRMVSFGGVFADTRPFGDGGSCGCIPALDLPANSRADDPSLGAILPVDAVVFGVVNGDEVRAYPRHMMELHELVNDDLGGDRVSLVYCTLCGSAQAFFSEGLVLRTSGLLQRSNKIMYDLESASAYDTFAGEAMTGPRRGEVLEQLTVVTTRWSEWVAAHPETTVMTGDPEIDYPLDPLGDRDAGGPIFPIGSVDERESAQTLVVGVTKPDGQAVAFHAQRAREALRDGGEVELAGVSLVLDGDGLRAVFDGEEIVSHESFWFAWSQRQPDTLWWE